MDGKVDRSESIAGAAADVQEGTSVRGQPDDQTVPAAAVQQKSRASIPPKKQVKQLNKNKRPKVIVGPAARRKKAYRRCLRALTTGQTKPVSWQRFLETITIDGLMDWYKSGSLIVKAIWILLICTMFGFLFYNLIQTVIEYTENPILTSIRVVAEIPKSFPDVYICPAVPIGYRMYENAGPKAKQAIEIMAKVANNSMSQFGILEYNELIFHAAHRPKDAILSCIFGITHCNESLMAIVLTANLGLCYKIPSRSDQTALIHSLRIMAQFPRLGDKHIFDPYDGEGATVGVAPRGRSPILIDYNWNVQEKTHSELQLKELKRNRLERRTGYKKNVTTDCIQESEGVNGFKVLRSNMYTRELCLLDCSSWYDGVQINNCVPALSWHVVREEYIASPVCDKDDHQSVEFNWRRDRCNEACQPPCEQTEYQGTLTSLSVKRPSNLVKPSEPNLTGFVKIEVKFTSLDVTHIAEAWSQTFSDFLSNIGGHIGLWMGASLMTLAQLIGFCFDAGHAAWRRRVVLRRPSLIFPTKRFSLSEHENLPDKD